MTIFPIKMRMPAVGNPAASQAPLMAAVVETTNDLIIIDTGFPGEPDIFERLEALHFHPSDFTLVINTHVHIDHVGNNHAFTNARIVVSRVDFDYAKKYSHALLRANDPVATLKEFFPHSNSRRIQASADHLLHMTQKYWRDDILGPPHRIQWIEDKPTLPPYVNIFFTPGHTPGHYSVKIKGQKTSFIIAGDAMPSRLFWHRKLQELTPRYSTKLFTESKAFIESMRGIVMGGHDRPFQTDDLTFIDAKKIVL